MTQRRRIGPLTLTQAAAVAVAAVAALLGAWWATAAQPNEDAQPVIGPAEATSTP